MCTYLFLFTFFLLRAALQEFSTMAGDGPATLFQARQKAPAIHIKAALSSLFIEALSRIKDVQFISAVATDCSTKRRLRLNLLALLLVPNRDCV